MRNLCFSLQYYHGYGYPYYAAGYAGSIADENNDWVPDVLDVNRDGKVRWKTCKN